MILWLGIIALALAAGALYVWYTRKVWFFRDPDHGQISQDDTLLLSPVYGIVAYVKKIEGGKVASEKLGEEILIKEITKTDWPSDEPSGNGWLIGIAMTALDVHYQYSPFPGKLNSIFHYQTGKNLPMFDLWEYIQITWLRRFVQLWCKTYVLENERQTFWIQGSRAKIALILIADKFVDKITTYVAAQDNVLAGTKLSFIARGSQVDILICDQPGLEVLVKEGQPVKGPLTPVAKLK